MVINHYLKDFDQIYVMIPATRYTERLSSTSLSVRLHKQSSSRGCTMKQCLEGMRLQKAAHQPRSTLATPIVYVRSGELARELAFHVDIALLMLRGMHRA